MFLVLINTLLVHSLSLSLFVVVLFVYLFVVGVRGERVFVFIDL